MALTTDRISVLRGRPPMRAGGRRGFRTAHCWLVRSLGYGFGFIPFLRSRPPFGTDSQRIDGSFLHTPVPVPGELCEPSEGRGRCRTQTSQRTGGFLPHFTFRIARQFDEPVEGRGCCRTK